MSPRENRSEKGSLCALCRHARVVQSSKGSTFLLCGLARENPAFPKYPPQPVVSCTGFAR